MTWWDQYIGLPFADGGRSPSGVDCWGLYALIAARHLGVALPDRPEISALAFETVSETASKGLLNPSWKRVEAGAEQGFDLAVIWRPYRDGQGRLHAGPIHCGCVTRPGFLIHCDEGTGTVELPYRPEPHPALRSGRVAFYRWSES